MRNYGDPSQGWKVEALTVVEIPEPSYWARRILRARMAAAERRAHDLYAAVPLPTLSSTKWPADVLVTHAGCLSRMP